MIEEASRNLRCYRKNRKKRLTTQIHCCVKHLQQCVCTAHSFCNVSSQHLTQIFIHGFDGQLDHLETMSANSVNARYAAIMYSATQTKTFLNLYPTRYGEDLKPIHRAQHNFSRAEIAMFDDFIALHRARKVITQVIAQSIKEISFIKRVRGLEHFKLMIEQIGYEVSYPGILDTCLNARKTCGDIKATFEKLRKFGNTSKHSQHSKLKSLLKSVDCFVGQVEQFMSHHLNQKGTYTINLTDLNR